MSTIEPVLPWNLDADYPRWSETLRDRTRVLIRPIRKEDGAEERAFIEALSPQSRRFRFLGQVGSPSDDLIERLTDIDYSQEVAFAAVVPEGARDKFVGVGRFSTDADGTACECAVTVLDAWHNRGLGTALMRHLIEVAQARGIRYMYSIDSAQNREMSELAGFMGFSRQVDPADRTQVIHGLWLHP